MDIKNAIITGVASYVPDYILTNEELSSMVDTNDEWITTRVGIKERRILKGEGLGSSELGYRAEMCIRDSYPYRTEKLSLTTPMVLRKSGRVGSRRF